MSEPTTEPKGHFHPDGRVRGSEQPVEGRCGKKLRGSDPPRYCTQWPVKGGTACRFCGGKSPKGAASPHYKHGRYSRHLPTDLRKKYVEAMGDKELISLRDELGILTTRMMTLMEKLSKTDAEPPWSQLVKEWDRMLNVREKGDGDALEKSLTRIETLIRTGREATRVQKEVWEELRALVQEKTKTAAQEWKRLNDINAVVSVDQAMLFARSLLEAAREVVKDRETLRLLQERALQLMPEEKVIEVAHAEG